MSDSNSPLIQTERETTDRAPVVARFSLHVQRIDAYEFRVAFDKPHYGELHMDEPAPLGRDAAPNAARVLGAAVGNCLSASLLFCLQRAGANVRGLESEIEMELVRNAAKRLRVGRVNVVLRPELEEESKELAHCIEMFEDYCVVTQSVRGGLDVRVRVEPAMPRERGLD